MTLIRECHIPRCHLFEHSRSTGLTPLACPRRTRRLCHRAWISLTCSGWVLSPDASSVSVPDFSETAFALTPSLPTSRPEHGVDITVLVARAKSNLRRSHLWSYPFIRSTSSDKASSINARIGRKGRAAGDLLSTCHPAPSCRYLHSLQREALQSCRGKCPLRLRQPCRLGLLLCRKTAEISCE